MVDKAMRILKLADIDSWQRGAAGRAGRAGGAGSRRPPARPPGSLVALRPSLPVARSRAFPGPRRFPRSLASAPGAGTRRLRFSRARRGVPALPREGGRGSAGHGQLPRVARRVGSEVRRASRTAEDVNVTFEDQQKINKFARTTSRSTELKEEIEVKKKQLQNLEDACDDILLAGDECLMIPYQIGDVFISHSQEETQEMLEEAKQNLQEEIDTLESRVASIQRVLADLKVQLYAKFGSNINLEADES
uniref:prefoldin subunit 4-like n=1 Tax=Jaculus jaculus TaxID=51337 RepID=UPI001E1B54D6|nr:prefoldin subunit 4-like [Jaculus jaculus]